MRRLEGMCLVGLLLSAGVVRGEESATFPSTDEQLLRGAGMATDTENLLAYVRTLTEKESTERVVQDLIRELGAREFSQRERAAKRLIGLGRVALPALRQNLKNEDPEVARRAEECVAAIDRQPWLNLPLIVVRLLVQRKVEEAVPLLLSYLGQTTDPDVEEEIYYGLDELAVRDGRGHLALVAALSDAHPARRGVASCILGRVGDSKQKQVVRNLLKDADAKVRLRAAQGLLAARENAAVPILIGLLDEPAVEIAWQAEELLHWVAGEAFPDAVVGSATMAERGAALVAWKKWWVACGEKVDWPSVERDCRRPGLVLLRAFAGDKGRGGVLVRLVLCGCDGARRYRFPQDVEGCDSELGGQAYWQHGGHLLAPLVEKECNLHEEDLTGKRLWESEPLEVGRGTDWKRMPDGTTLVADGKFLMEVDSRGKKKGIRSLPGLDGKRTLPPSTPEEIERHQRRFFRPFVPAFRGLPGGEGTYEPGPLGARFGKDGRLFIAVVGQSGEIETIAEYHNATGAILGVKKVAANKKDGPDLGFELSGGELGFGNAVRLRNGNTLVAPLVEKEKESLPVELDRQRKKVWETAASRSYGSGEVICPLIRFGFSRSATTEPSLDTVSAQLRMTKSRYEGFRERAVEWLQTAPPSKEVGTVFLDRLNHPDEYKRREALIVVFRCRAHLDGVLPLMARMLEDESDQMWSYARWALAQMGTEAIPVLLGIRKDQTKPASVRANAAVSLSWMLKHGHLAVIPAVREALREGPPRARAEVIWELQRVADRGAAVFVPELLEALHAGDKDVVINAGETLAKLGSRGDKAVPALLEALTDRRCRSAAARALKGIHPKDPAVIDKLVQQLEDKEDWGGRWGVIDALESYGASAKRAVPALIEALDDPHVLGREGPTPKPVPLAAVKALASIGPDARAAVPRLLAMVKDSKELSFLRQMAADTISKIDPAAGKTAHSILRSEPPQ